MKPRKVSLVVAAFAFVATFLWTTPWRSQRVAEYSVYIPSKEAQGLKLKSSWAFAPEDRKRMVSVKEFVGREGRMRGIEYSIQAVKDQLQVDYYGQEGVILYHSMFKRQWLAPYFVWEWEETESSVRLVLYRSIQLVVFWLSFFPLVGGLIAYILTTEKDG